MSPARLLRSVWKHRAANAVTVATLAATVAVLLAAIAVAHNFFVSPWSYDTMRLGVLTHRASADTRSLYGFSAEEYRTLRDSGLFDRMVASRGRPVALEGPDGYPTRMLMVQTEPSAREVTGVAPALGRFLSAEDAAGSTAVVISHALWQSQFGGAADVLGRALRVEDTLYTVVGVMPDRFHFMGGDLWSAHARNLDTDLDAARPYVLNVRFKPGTDLADLRGALATLAQRLVAAAPASRYLPGWTIGGERVIDAVMGPMRPAVGLLFVASLLMLLVVLANVATLINVRQVAAEPQLAVRLALGATSRRLHVEAFATNLLLAALGVGLGWLLGGSVFDRIVGLISADWIPRELEGRFVYAGASLRWMPPIVLGCAALMTLSQWPRLRRVDAQGAVRGSARIGASGSVLRAIRGLAALQVAAATVVGALAVCVGAGTADIRARALGLRVDDVASTRLTLPQAAYPDPAARRAFAERLRAALRSEPAVAEVAFVDAAPFQRYRRQTALRADRPGGPFDISVALSSSLGPVSEVLGLGLLHGRYLDDARDSAGAPPVAVISRALALQVWGSEDVLGRMLSLGSDGEAAPRRVVGVLDDVRYGGALAEPERLVLIPHAQDAALPAGLVVLARGSGGVPGADVLARAAAGVDPRVPLFDTVRLADRAQASLAGLNLAEAAFRVFAALAVVLALMGTVVVLSFLLAVRRREYAVRSAIGAAPARLARGVVGEGAAIGAAGALAGLAVAWAVAGLVDASLYGVTPWRWPVVAAVVAGVLAAVALATLAPARRAAASDPMLALRSE
ncbi:MAG TPA: ABC transporter permease [Dokdonella sp.]|uniref:ABC transporter permease n=1 Tax=Dokdonella sp. TaxID=2291710 RepID=UPI002B53BE98|nr:ABC transporter permease [Dokdonella sp.]HUD40562.1 ABC transporter permease [Dokdonella sp.]